MKHTPIPNTLREHRKRANLRQIDIAKALGFKSTDRISLWEKGLTYPHVVNLFKLARIYVVLPHELYPEISKHQLKISDSSNT
jgi:transcriptional regulator with XRE-family HTH domain